MDKHCCTKALNQNRRILDIVRPTSLGASWGNQGNRTGFVNQDRHIYRVHYDVMEQMQSRDSCTKDISNDPSNWNFLRCCRAAPMIWDGKYVPYSLPHVTSCSTCSYAHHLCLRQLILQRVLVTHYLLCSYDLYDRRHALLPT